MDGLVSKGKLKYEMGGVAAHLILQIFISSLVQAKTFDIVKAQMVQWETLWRANFWHRIPQ